MIAFKNGMILVLDAFGGLKGSYRINRVSACFKEDRPNLIGILRCHSLQIESNAPNQIEDEAKTNLFNILADREYNAAGEDNAYKEEAKKDICSLTGVDAAKVEISVER